jgi:TonB-linked SusC/RagA family outer membrane protein
MKKKNYYQLLIRVMRVSFIQLVIIAFALGNVKALEGNAQPALEKKVTLNVSNQEVEKVLREIERHIDVRFVFSGSLIRADRKVNMRVKNQVLHKVLDELLTPLDLKYRASENLVVISRLSRKEKALINSVISTPEQVFVDRTIRGKVMDENGEGLPGVSIVLKGTQRGTISSIDGGYELVVPDGENSLVFSFVGYLPEEISITSERAVLDISMKVDKKALDEVVVVGYGTQSRRNVTGSVSKVNMKSTEDLPNTNVTQALRGRVAGVQFTDNSRPGQNGTILIRGPRSLNGGNNPLIVVDGIFFNGSMADLNPNDIESMEVLKDASSAAIYGSRAANGVILITSKKGATEKPTIRINSFFGVSDWSYRPKLLSAERYLQKTLDNRAQSGLEADPAKVRDYLTTSEQVNYDAGVSVDPYDAISQKGRISSYDLSLSGRTQITNYFLSGSFMDEKGLIYNDNMKRVALRGNIENKINPWLSVGMNSSYIRRDLSGREASLSSAAVATPYGTWFHPDGEPTWYIIAEDQIPYNAMRDAIFTKNEEIYNNLFANFYAFIEIPAIKGLSYRFNYSPNYRWQHTYNFVRQDKHEPHINNTSASKNNREDFDWVMENIVTYSTQINEANALDITLLYGRNHNGFESTSSSATRLSSDALGWNNLGLGEILNTSSTAQASDGVSSMFRLNYRLLNKYLFTGTVRRDGSSVFAANNKYATFPSVAVAWIASDEPFLENAKFLNSLKVRLSYGAVGNQAINPYQSLSLSGTQRYVFSDGGTSSLGVFPSNMANSNLKWETTYTANAAVDFDLFKGRLEGTLELYNMDTRDLLVQRSLPDMTGYSFVLTNLGATNNKGFEFTLNTINFKRQDFEWRTNFVFSRNKNKIVHLYNSDTNGDGKEDDDLGNKWFIGSPMNVAFDYVFDGIYQEGDEMPSGYQPGFVRLKDLNGDGRIEANDRQIIGQTQQPKYRWGITNTFQYKNLTLSVFVNAMQGWISHITSVDYSVSGGNYPHRPLNMLDAGWWTAENKSQTRPSMVYPNPFGHSYYYSRDFIRIQDVSLAYDLPDALTERLKMGEVRFNLSAKNLYNFTKWIGSDPENGYTTNGSFFPTARSLTLGVNMSF